MIVLGILRGPLRYGEQLSGHYIAFKMAQHQNVFLTALSCQGTFITL